MPVDWNIKSTWDSAYNVRVRDKSDNEYNDWKTYGRKGFHKHSQQRLIKLEALEDSEGNSYLRQNDKILVVGCGLGFLVELLNDNGYRAYGLDISTYIRDRVASETNQDTRNRFILGDILSPTIGLTVSSTIGGKAAVVITENILPVIPALSTALFFANCEAIASRQAPILHILTCPKEPNEYETLRQKPPLWDADWQWMKLSEWATQATNRHIFLDAGLHNQIVGTLL